MPAAPRVLFWGARAIFVVMAVLAPPGLKKSRLSPVEQKVQACDCVSATLMFGSLGRTGKKQAGAEACVLRLSAVPVHFIELFRRSRDPSATAMYWTGSQDHGLGGRQNSVLLGPPLVANFRARNELILNGSRATGRARPISPANGQKGRT